MKLSCHAILSKVHRTKSISFWKKKKQETRLLKQIFIHQIDFLDDVLFLAKESPGITKFTLSYGIVRTYVRTNERTYDKSRVFFKILLGVPYRTVRYGTTVLDS